MRYFMPMNSQTLGSPPNGTTRTMDRLTEKTDVWSVCRTLRYFLAINELPLYIGSYG